jgi:hypothetical protein
MPICQPRVPDSGAPKTPRPIALVTTIRLTGAVSSTAPLAAVPIPVVTAPVGRFHVIPLPLCNIKFNFNHKIRHARAIG